MRLIAQLSRQITDETESALEYAKDALTYRQTRPELAATYHKLSMQEQEHAQQLHNHAQQIVIEAENSGIDYPQSMRNRWEEQHKLIIERMAEASTFINMWK